MRITGAPNLVERQDYKQIGLQRWKLLRDVELWYNGYKYRVRAGFEWDGASVPAFAHWYAKPGDYKLASLLHDCAYLRHRVERWDGKAWLYEWVPVSKSFADGLFHDILRDVYGVRIGKVDVMWAAVHVAGWLSWWRGTCNDKCGACPANAGGWCPYQWDAKS